MKNLLNRNTLFLITIASTVLGLSYASQYGALKGLLFTLLAFGTFVIVLAVLDDRGGKRQQAPKSVLPSPTEVSPKEIDQALLQAQLDELRSWLIGGQGGVTLIPMSILKKEVTHALLGQLSSAGWTYTLLDANNDLFLVVYPVPEALPSF